MNAAPQKQAFSQRKTELVSNTQMLTSFTHPAPPCSSLPQPCSSLLLLAPNLLILTSIYIPFMSVMACSFTDKVMDEGAVIVRVT